ncbi:hypothetical protein [Pseudomonas sp.]|uniref:hypothetical protein n=1 Tax=Pseudomonas sp. TaxID=306 RepID=UPI0028A7562C|nr:hypothetical protein [Pseudomonas sp.]
MHISTFGHHLLFLAFFIASVVSWLYLWLVGFLHPSVASSDCPVLKPDALTVVGLLSTLGCAVLEFFSPFEGVTLLIVLLVIGLIMPWGGALGGRYHERLRTRRF